MRRRIAQVIAAGAAAAGLVLGGMAFADAAYAAGTTTVSITPSATTVPSNTAVTYTLNISCSGTAAGCGTSTVSFPTTAITGNGTNVDFGSWITAGTCPALSKSGGVATFDVTSFIGAANASQQCAFTVRAPDYTTLDGAVATITPTLTTANGGTSTGAAVTLTSTATHNSSFTSNATSQVVPGGGMSFTLFFQCRGAAKVGDIGSDPITITAQLPSTFTYTGRTPGFSGTFTTPAVGAQGGTFSYTGSSADCAGLSATATGFTIAINGTANSASGPVQSGTICATTSASWKYLDDSTATSSAVTTPCTTVRALDTTTAKAAGNTSPINNSGQFTFGGASPVYTYPGDWDATGANASWTISYRTNPVAVTTAGVSYGIQDPMPCLTGGPVGGVYSSLAPGTTCASPTFIPTAATPAGFTPAAGATVTLRYADGTTGTVAYAGGKWTIPTTKPVSEIDFPPYTEQGSNTAAVMSYRIDGYASATAQVGTELKNTAVVTSYLSADLTTTVSTVKSPTDVLYVGDPSTVTIKANITPGTPTNCVVGYGLGNTAGRQNLIQFAQGASQAIYYDFLLPAGATYAGPTTTTFRLAGPRTYTSAPITPTSTTNYNGTGRTLLEWVIPAGLATLPGTYQLGASAGFNVQLPLGCAGTYSADITLGYGGPTQAWCYTSSPAVKAPLDPSPTSDLKSNGTPTTNNYCGFSAPLTVAPINPGFSVDKSVKGDLDAATVGGGGIGKVAPAGGSATYTVTFTNTGASNLHDPVLYDLLPRVGDTNVTSTAARGSQFTATFTGITPPAGVTVAYSTATNPCRPEVLPTNAGCTDDWTSTAPGDLATVTALRLTYTGTIGVTGSTVYPVNTFSVPYTVSTPNTTVGNVAWNTVGTNVHSGDTGDPAATTDLLAPAESSRTGLTASSGVPAIVKATGTASFNSVGDTVDFTFDVTNNAAATLTNITVVDAFTDAAAGSTPPTVTCAPTTLIAGATAHCTAAYAVTQADLDHRTITDVATATGTTSGGGTISNTSNAVTVNAIAAPKVTLQKSATVNSALGTSVSSTADVINYSFLVTNTGNQTVTIVGISDPMLAAVSITCPQTTLAPTASTTCTADYSPTQTDLDAGSIANTATATALSPAGTAVTSATSTATITVAQTSALTLTKTASPTTVDAVGQTVTFSFAVKNTGNVTLTGLGITDSMLTTSAICAVTTLAPTDTTVCSGPYTVDQADLDHGSIDNTATAAADAPQGAAVTSAPSTASVGVIQSPALSLVKTANPTAVAVVGATVTYSFAVTNTGNVTVSTITIDDPMLPAVASCPQTTLAPTASTTCTGVYTTTQADFNAGSIVNTATAEGMSPAAAAVTSAPASATVTVVQNAHLALTQTADTTKVTTVGQVVHYTFHVVNDGNVTLTNVTATPGTFTGTGAAPTITCPAGAASLAPGDSVDCTASYTAVAGDTQLTTLNLTAIATGTAAGASVPSDPASTAIPVALPAIAAVGAAVLAATGIVGASTSLVTAIGLLVAGGVLLLIRRRRNGEV